MFSLSIPAELGSVIQTLGLAVTPSAWSVNNTGGGYSVTLTWGSIQTKDTQGEKVRVITKKTPSALRRDRRRREDYLRSRKNASNSATVSATSSVQLTDQTNSVTCTQDSATQYDIASVSEFSTQTDVSCVSDAATQYENNYQNQDVKQKSEGFKTVAELLQALNAVKSDTQEYVNVLNAANEHVKELNPDEVARLSVMSQSRLPRNPQPLKVAIMDYQDVGISEPLGLTYQDAQVLNKQPFLSSSIKLHKYTTHTRVSDIEGFVLRSNNMEWQELKGLFVNVRGQIHKLSPYTQLGQIPGSQSGHLVLAWIGDFS